MSIFGKAAHFLGKAKTSGGFGFKDKVQQAGKKMYGFGERHPIATTAGILGGAYALGQTDMWQNPENIEHSAINKWFKKPWDENSPQEAAMVYKRYVEMFRNRLPNATKEEFHRFEMDLQKSILSKPGTPEKYKKRLDSINKQFSQG